MSSFVLIRENETGKVAKYTGSFATPFENGVCWWEEGNGGCDCNRNDFFHQALGLEEEDDVPCSHGKFSVKVIENDEVVYDEMPEVPA